MLQHCLHCVDVDAVFPFSVQQSIVCFHELLKAIVRVETMPPTCHGHLGPRLCQIVLLGTTEARDEIGVPKFSPNSSTNDSISDSNIPEPYARNTKLAF